MKKQVIIFARSPFSGQVKTRLAKTMGTQAARGIYARLLYETIFNLLSDSHPEVQVTLSLASQKGLRFFRDAFPELAVTVQSPGNLGRRMQTALNQAFEQGATKSVLIGSDLPGMKWDIIENAFEITNANTITLGPSTDGGFYLIGMSQIKRNLLANIQWSTPAVLTQLQNNLKQAGLQTILLPTRRDIDQEEDWREWQSKIKAFNQIS